MDILFFKSILAGLLLGVPAGPIGAVAIRTMLLRGAVHSIFLGLGCALVDVIYAGIIGLGTNYMSNFLTSYKFLFELLGQAFLLVIGIKIFFSKPITALKADNSSKGYIGSFFITFFLALSSPATVLSFTAVFSSLGLSFTKLLSLTAIKLIAGIVIGGAIWWVILGIGIKFFKSKIDYKFLKYSNKVFGTLIIGIVLYLSLL